MQRDAYLRKISEEQALKQAIANAKKLEIEVKNKNAENELLQREMQRAKDDKEAYKEKFNQILQDS